MSVGQINQNLELRVKLQVANESVEFLVDTGFNGHLAVSKGLVARSGLKLEPFVRPITLYPYVSGRSRLCVV